MRIRIEIQVAKNVNCKILQFLDPWIQLRIRIETNSDPQHCMWIRITKTTFSIPLFDSLCFQDILRVWTVHGAHCKILQFLVIKFLDPDPHFPSMLDPDSR